MRNQCLQDVYNSNFDIRVKFQTLDTRLPVHAMRFHIFLTSSRFTPCKNIHTKCIGVWVDPRTGLND
jgi:hypothetical protein